MAVKATSSDFLATAALLHQRVEQVKAELDNLSPTAQVAAFEKVQGENMALIELQSKVHEAFGARTHSFVPDLEPIETKLKATAQVLESIESNIVLASNFIALAAQAESVFRQKPPQNVIQINSLQTRVTLLLNQSPNQGVRAAIEALHHKLLAILEPAPREKMEPISQPAPQKIVDVKMPKIEDPVTRGSLKDVLKFCCESSDLLKSRMLVRKTYAKINDGDKGKIFNAYNEIRKSEQQQPLPQIYLTQISIEMWPGISSRKLLAVEKIPNPSS